MPKDNEVDEKAVAWMLTRKRDGFIRATYNVKPTDEQIAIAEHDGDVYVPLTYAATVAELRAEVERLSEQLRYVADACEHETARADAAERRVGELEAGVSVLAKRWRAEAVKLREQAGRALRRENAGYHPAVPHSELAQAAKDADSYAHELEALTGADPT